MVAWGLPEDAVGRLLQARWQRPLTRMSDLHDVLGRHARLVPGEGWARLAIWSLCLLLVVHLVMLSMDWREERGEEYRRLAGEWLKL